MSCDEEELVEVLLLFVVESMILLGDDVSVRSSFSLSSSLKNILVITISPVERVWQAASEQEPEMLKNIIRKNLILINNYIIRI